MEMGIWSRLFGGGREAESASPPSEDRHRSGRVTSPDGRTAIEWSASGPSSAPPEGYVSPYLSAPEQAELLRLDEEGLPNLRLQQYRGEWWLAEISTGRFVNAGSRELKRLGIWSVRVRGDEYAPGDLQHGHVELVREPQNEHDPNAVGVVQNGVRCGYWNRGGARSLAKVLDGGSELVGYAISCDPPKIIACDVRTLEHLLASR